MLTSFDSIVIGAGQAGPFLAAKLVAVGEKVALIERRELGGTCVNDGCIPTKTLIASARAAWVAKQAANFGVVIDGAVSVNMPAVKARKDAIVEESRQSLRSWLSGLSGLTLIHGQARFVGPQAVRVGNQEFRAKRFFINCGARAVVPSLPGIDSVPFLTNTEMMALEALPEHLVILGGSYIGLEFAQMYRRFGSRVTILEHSPQLVPREDPDVSNELASILRNEGIDVVLNAELESVGPVSVKVAGTHQSPSITPIKTGELAGTTQGVKVAGTAQSVKVAGTAQSVKVAGTAQSVKVAGTAQSVKVAGTTQGVKVAGTAQGVQVAGTAQGVQVAGTAQSGDIAVKHRGGVVVGSHLLVATGRIPNTDDLGLELAGVERDARGHIVVDDELKTNQPHIYALGDCNGRGAFTHTSYNDFEMVADNLLKGAHRRVTDRIEIYGLYTDPPLGRVGLNETQAKALSLSYLVAKRPMSRVGRARERGETAGFMKILVDPQTKHILGATILGIEGDEAISCIADTMYAKAPYALLQQAVHPHPTVAELIPTLLGDLQPAGGSVDDAGEFKAPSGDSSGVPADWPPASRRR